MYNCIVIAFVTYADAPANLAPFESTALGNPKELEKFLYERRKCISCGEINRTEKKCIYLFRN